MYGHEFIYGQKMGERMIMAVFRRPVLWNMRIDIYRDKNKTNQAWKEIGEEFGLPGTYMFLKNIKTFIRYLRKTTAKVSEEKLTLRRIT